MNWKILLAGSVVIIAIFVSFLGFQFIQNRSNNLNIPGSNNTFSVTTFENGVIPLEAQKAIEAEVKTQNQLIRGRVSSYNQNTNSFTVAMEQKQLNGSLAVIGLIEVVIEEKLINEFLCWPEFFEALGDGKDPIDIKTAFLPFNNNSYLFMKGETKKQLSQLPNYMNNSHYVFAMLSTAITDDLSVIKDTSAIGPQNLKELAILGCNETN